MQIGAIAINLNALSFSGENSRPIPFNSLVIDSQRITTFIDQLILS